MIRVIIHATNNNDNSNDANDDDNKTCDYGRARFGWIDIDTLTLIS